MEAGMIQKNKKDIVVDLFISQISKTLIQNLKYRNTNTTEI